MIKSTLTNNNNTLVVKQLWSNVVSDILRVRNKPNSYTEFFEFINETQSVKVVHMQRFCLGLGVPPIELKLSTTTAASYVTSTYNADTRIAVMHAYLQFNGHISECISKAPVSVFDAVCPLFISGYLNSVEAVFEGVKAKPLPGQIVPKNDNNVNDNFIYYGPVQVANISGLEFESDGSTKG